MREKLSGFFDGELNQNQSEQLVRHLKDDMELRQQWQRYSFYRSAMRDELSPVISNGFSDNVLAILKQEPVQLAPASIKKPNGLRNPLVGMAVAASLLVVAILIQKPALQDTQEIQVSTASVVPAENTLAIPVSGETKNILARTQRAYAADESKVVQYDLIVANSKNENVRERINRLLVEHNEYNPASDMTGIMSYSRFVGYSPNVDSH